MVLQWLLLKYVTFPFHQISGWPWIDRCSTYPIVLLPHNPVNSERWVNRGIFLTLCIPPGSYRCNRPTSRGTTPAAGSPDVADAFSPSDPARRHNAVPPHCCAAPPEQVVAAGLGWLRWRPLAAERRAAADDAARWPARNGCWNGINWTGKRW